MAMRMRFVHAAPRLEIGRRPVAGTWRTLGPTGTAVVVERRLDLPFLNVEMATVSDSEVQVALG